jgi:hypothetical protein
MIKDKNVADDAGIQLYKILGGAAFGAGEMFFVGTSGTAAYNWWRSRVPTNKLDRTLNAAVAKTVAARGDKIIVLPQHTEAISAAGGVTLDKDGIEIIGVGVGSYRPTFTLGTATTATWLHTGNNIAVNNVKIDSTGIDAIAAPITITCTLGGATYRNVEHYFAKTSYVSLLGMSCTTAASANYLTLDNCYMHGDAVANCTNYLQLVGGDSIKIINNYIRGNFTTSLGCVNNITAVTTNILIRENVLQNGTASATKVVVLYTGSTGFCGFNRIGIGSGTAPVTGDAIHWAGNWTAAAVATAGTLM